MSETILDAGTTGKENVMGELPDLDLNDCLVDRILETNSLTD